MKQVHYLKSAHKVVKYATKVINRADDELIVATDNASFGLLSDSLGSDEYRLALEGANSKKRLSDFKAMWLSDRASDFYARHVYNMASENLDIFKEKNKKMEKELSNCNPVKSDLDVLGFNNFWVSKDAKGNFHTVVAWLNASPPSGTEMRGFYTKSPDIAELMMNVWDFWKMKTDENYMQKLVDGLHEDNRKGAPAQVMNTLESGKNDTY